jgi:hypothetical protein
VKTIRNGFSLTRWTKPLDVAAPTLMTYTIFMQGNHAKRAAWLLLLLLVLDLSTSGICSAGTFPFWGGRSAASMTESPLAQAPPAQNLDDDGCFCCCTHMLPGTHVDVVPPMPLVAGTSILIVSNLSAVPRTHFHPPKR